MGLQLLTGDSNENPGGPTTLSSLRRLRLVALPACRVPAACRPDYLIFGTHLMDVCAALIAGVLPFQEVCLLFFLISLYKLIYQ